MVRSMYVIRMAMWQKNVVIEGHLKPHQANVEENKLVAIISETFMVDVDNGRCGKSNMP